MVAVIKTGSSIRRIFLYNENKVELGLASCLAAINYPMDAHDMTSAMRLNRLLQQAALNSRVTRNSVHISLNFDPSEKDLSDGRLIEIAKRYMQGIGFSEQPFLIYRHLDAAHPHIHLVSTKVRSDGSRIDMHNIGRNQSEKVRCLIEREFNLVSADDSKLKVIQMPKAIDVARVQYGQVETRGAIQNVLEQVLNSYNYVSLPQLNAILRQFNVMVDQGSDRSRMYIHKGLLYRLLDDQGNKVGVPIKASALYSKPTFRNLQQRFERNQALRMQLKAKAIYSIDRALKGKLEDMGDFKVLLQQQGIHLVLRSNTKGDVYGITYVDHKNKCVFNGSELGKQYSAKGILERVKRHNLGMESLRLNTVLYKRMQVVQANAEQYELKGAFYHGIKILSIARNPLEALFQVPRSADYIPKAFMKRKKKRKKNISY